LAADMRACARASLRDCMRPKALQQSGPQAAATLLREDARRNVRVPGIRTVHEAAPRKLPVELGEDVQVARLDAAPQLVEARRALVRQDRPADREPRLVVRVRLAGAEPDHPDLFSCLCVFA